MKVLIALVLVASAIGAEKHARGKPILQPHKAATTVEKVNATAASKNAQAKENLVHGALAVVEDFDKPPQEIAMFSDFPTKVASSKMAKHRDSRDPFQAGTEDAFTQKNFCYEPSTGNFNIDCNHQDGLEVNVITQCCTCANANGIGFKWTGVSGATLECDDSAVREDVTLCQECCQKPSQTSNGGDPSIFSGTCPSPALDNGQTPPAGL